MTYSKKNLYVLDSGNYRIAELNLDTGKFQYFKEEKSNSFGDSFHIIDDDTFLGTFRSLNENRGRLGIVNKEMKLIRNFFDRLPVKIDLDKSKPGGTASVERIARFYIAGSYLQPICGVDPDKQRILVSFLFPDNPIVFFVYDLRGNLLKEFSYAVEDKNYKFPMFFLKGSLDKLRDPNLWPRRNELKLNSIFLYRGHYVAFLNLRDYEKNELLKNHSFCLIFNEDGKLVEKLELKDSLRIFGLCNNYFLGNDWDEEIERLYIFKLNL